MTCPKKRVLKNLAFCLCITSLMFALSCKPEDEIITKNQNAFLAFSVDTVLFDTVFSTVGSISKRLKVFNRSKNAINIASLSVAGGDASPYRIFVNGVQQVQASDQVILGGDSLLIVVQVTVDPGQQNLPFLVKDSLVFTTNANVQNVKLIAYGQDAVFYNNAVLPCNTTWTSEKPYVIRKAILVDSICRLTIQKGAKIYLSNGAYIFVKGSINVQGTAEEPILFTNDRLDAAFKNAPGQWNGIYFLEGSKDNVVNYAKIRNADIGIRLGTPDNDTIPDVIVSNTIIENMSTAGILTFTSDLYAYNTLVNNCGSYTVANLAGGHYTYEHCTFANYNFIFFRQQPSVVFSDNLILEDNSTLIADLSIKLSNTIIWGSLPEEIQVSSAGSKVVIAASNNILRTQRQAFFPGNIQHGSNISFPKFVEPEAYNYRLDTLSPAKDAGILTDIALDLDGKERDDLPDIGAYERQE